ncbi:hypothetical protein CEXT_214051 [Caerostris extrusa]|uniref:Uncharacterized protein n=1 Tax=Caerostris extrusa TaxID=172846 RepID=A0AAV4R1I1_CAEEX|nr:hypothetical protein CEXT_214051 [Caerostris extrusa]
MFHVASNRASHIVNRLFKISMDLAKAEQLQWIVLLFSPINSLYCNIFLFTEEPWPSQGRRVNFDCSVVVSADGFVTYVGVAWHADPLTREKTILSTTPRCESPSNGRVVPKKACSIEFWKKIGVWECGE